MARTDKTRPLTVQMREVNFSWRETTNRDSLAAGPRAVRACKRIKARQDRRSWRRDPESAPCRAPMRGEGWGYRNYRYALADLVNRSLRNTKEH